MNHSNAIVRIVNSLKRNVVWAMMLFFVHSAVGKDLHIVVTVTNALNIDRPNEMIEIPWNDLRHLKPALDTSNVLVSEKNTDSEILSQIVCESPDTAQWKLIFLSNFSAKETKQFSISVVDRKHSVVQSVTDARFVKPRDDVAWENDRIAYRIYGPALDWELNNGLDVWNKRVRYLVIEKWYKGDEAPEGKRISYHEDHGEGADMFNTGRSLGAGSCALYADASLYQPGVFASYKIFSIGPLRAAFEVTYKPVRFQGAMVTEVMRYSLDAGSNLNRIEVTFHSDSLMSLLPFAAGLVKRSGVVSALDKKTQCASLWGPTDDHPVNGSLGIGIVMTKEAFQDMKEDSNYVLVLCKVKPNKPAMYYAGAGWTGSGDFKSVLDWNNYLKEFSQRLESPLKISLSIEP